MSITRVYSDGNTVSGSDMNTIISGINTNETSINGLTTNKVDKIEGKSLVLDTEIAKIHSHANSTVLNNTTASYTTTEQTKLNGVADNSTKTELSTTNGNIKINGTEAIVYTHPTGTTTTNPHGTTKSDIGLSDVDNTSDITKNVLSATKLTTPRTINGVSFDGSANITLPTLSNNSDSSMNNFKITNVGEPINGQDVVTKNYADSLRAGLSVKDTVRVATTVNLIGTYNTLVFTSTDLGAIVIDGITLALNDRVLVKNQTVATQNGIYYVSQVGDISTPYKLTRANDSNTSSKVVEGMSTWIDEGTVNSDCRWVLITNSTIILDTTGLVFTKDFQSSDLIANGGITKSGNTISLTTGIATTGTYKSVTVDTNGRVTGGTNPSTIAGYGITDFASNVLSTVLIGLSTATNSVISVTDTVLSSLGKLQKQISDNLTTLSTHIADGVKHITSAERTLWNSKQDAIVIPTIQTATLVNGWIDYASGLTTTTYFKTVEEIVHLRGTIKSGTTSNPTLLFVLPAGYRPASHVFTIAIASNTTLSAFVQINVMTDGSVYLLENNGYNTWLSLTSVIFPTF